MPKLTSHISRILSVVTLIFVPIEIFSHSWEEKIIYREETSLSSEINVVEIRSFYGDLEIIPSDDELVVMIVKLDVPDHIKFPLDEFREYHALGLYEQGGRLKIDNLIANAPSMWWRTFGASFSKKNISISIIIKLPSDLKIMLDQRDGNTYLENSASGSHFNLNNSQLRAGILTGGSTLVLDHSEVEIDFADSVQIFSSHSSIQIFQSNLVEINSSHSEVTVFQAKYADVASVYDPQIRFYSCSNAKVESASSNLFFHRIGDIIMVQSLNDTIYIKELVNSVQINSEESFVHLKFEKCRNGSIDFISTESKYLIELMDSCGLLLELDADHKAQFDLPDIEWEIVPGQRSLNNRKLGEAELRVFGEIIGGFFLLRLIE